MVSISIQAVGFLLVMGVFVESFSFTNSSQMPQPIKLPTECWPCLPMLRRTDNCPPSIKSKCDLLISARSDQIAPPIRTKRRSFKKYFKKVAKKVAKKVVKRVIKSSLKKIGK